MVKRLTEGQSKQMIKAEKVWTAKTKIFLLTYLLLLKKDIGWVA